MEELCVRAGEKCWTLRLERNAQKIKILKLKKKYFEKFNLSDVTSQPSQMKATLQTASALPLSVVWLILDDQKFRSKTLIETIINTF